MKYINYYLIIVLIIFSSTISFAYIPIQVQSFKKALQNSNQTVNCANCDFRGVQELAGVNAQGAHMPGVTFQPCVSLSPTPIPIMICTPNVVADLTGINLANANLFSSCFDQAILDNANLSGADVSNSSFQNVSLKNANVTGIITQNATFCNSIMPDGTVCTETWTGQGVTIACNCVTPSADKLVSPTPSGSLAVAQEAQN